MTTPESGAPGSGEDAAKSGDPTAEAPFDPYRYGKPDRPIPPEYAPPGYTPPPPTAPEVSHTSPYGPSSPYGSAPPPYGSAPYGSAPYGSSPYAGGPPPTGQQQYGAPPQYPNPYPGGYGAAPPGYQGYSAPTGGNGKAVAALVLGIVSIVFFWLSVFDGILIVLAVIFGLLALGDAKSRGGRGRGMAIAGLICMAVGTVAATIWTVAIIHAANKCGGFNNTSTQQFKTCFRDQF